MPAPPENYRELAPCAALRPYVECFWSRRGDAAASHRVLPDGCLDIVFNFGDGPAWRAVVVGTMTRAMVVAPGRREEFLGIRFRPGKARAFLQPPADEFTDRVVPLDALWGRAGVELEARLTAMPTLRARVAAMENELFRRLAHAPPPDTRLDAAIEEIVGRCGAVPIEHLGKATGRSRQHLARKFSAEVGIGPKLFSRVVRFRRLAESTRTMRLGWAEAAVAFGYYDQAHLIADFKEFAGLTPSQLLAAR